MTTRKRSRRSRKSRASRRHGNSKSFYMQKYQGWSNWVTWNVALWVGNEYQVYKSAEAYKRKHGKFTAAAAKEFVKEFWPRGTPDMLSSHHRGQHGGYAAVDWKEIAESLNEE